MTYYNMLNSVRSTVGGLDEVYFKNNRHEGLNMHSSHHEFKGPEAVNEFKRFVDSYPVSSGIRKGFWDIKTFGLINPGMNRSGTRYDITVDWEPIVVDETICAKSVTIIKNLDPTDEMNSVGIKNVIFNPPATIVFWTDGTKTVVKCDQEDTYDPEKGLAMAISKKMLGNKYEYYNNFKKWLKKV